ncbi:bifunctional protein-serine/threonine kinase/phosphatase [Aromatoleum sp.]|uniref:bifunctional protein-serine/threonine kinase/phosphatase n=1 Tax=Aromatoleum sp. TaxID=2307007 RepID=UPI002FCAE96B
MATIIEAGTRFRATAPAKAAPDLAAPATRAAGEALQITLGHASQQGLRPANEDFVGAVTPDGALLEYKGMLLAIADGVGGHARGREAAEYSVRGLLADYFSTPDTWSVEKSLDTVIGALNRWLLAQSAKSREYAGMATTLTAFVLRGRRYHVAHVGDSRAYLYRGGELRRLTEDHTWDHPEFDNVLRRAVGLNAQLAVDFDDGELMAGDRFVLVTDGVWGALGDGGIAELLERNANAEDVADILTLAALARGATDNCTALVTNVVTVPPDNLRDRLAGARRLPLPPPLKAGDVLDGLHVDALLHESRVTLLYRVTREATGEALVMKTLRSGADDDEAAAALLREEWLARRAPSQAFPTVADAGGRSCLYYLMSWHEGETLKAKLARGHRFPPHELVAIGAALLRAVGALHRLGIVHRDVKPDNVHLDRGGHLRLLDLGVAASDADDLREINNPGTPSYMAPQLFAGEAASESSDIYACGVTLYELLTRKYPYGEVEPFQRPRFGEPVPPTRYRPDTPAWLEAVLLKACARDAKERFETAEEFLLALERGAHRPLAKQRRTPLVARNPGLALKLVVAASLLLNLILLFLLSRH